mmetsp:Transcript_29980/g.63584  ORF Transcript_29980/g.63584 Transcript_29980/m.63584 type:complete len:120 (-) Transcript_29980:443-802(-)
MVVIPNTARSTHLLQSTTTWHCIINKSIAKTNTRYTAERSLVGSMALLIIVAMTHFHIVAEDDSEWRQIMNELKEEDRVLYNMVQYFHGNKPLCVRPHDLMFSADDETDFICEDVQPDI